MLTDPTTAVDSVTEQHIAERVAARYTGSGHPAHRVLVLSEAPAWQVVATTRWDAADLDEALAEVHA